MLFNLKALSYSMLNVLKTLFFASILVTSWSIIPFTFAQNATMILSPLKQLKNGVSVKDIQCKKGLLLVVKSEDGFPACVKLQTAQKLVERGWGIMFSKQEQQGITKEDAINIVKNKFFVDRTLFPLSKTYFAFLKYNSTTSNGDLQFIMYQTDPISKIINGEGQLLVFHKEIKGYLSDKLVDRFIWTVITSEGAIGTTVFYLIDANTGQVIAIWTPCTGCY